MPTSTNSTNTHQQKLCTKKHTHRLTPIAALQRRDTFLCLTRKILNHKVTFSFTIDQRTIKSAPPLRNAGPSSNCCFSWIAPTVAPSHFTASNRFVFEFFYLSWFMTDSRTRCFIERDPKRCRFGQMTGECSTLTALLVQISTPSAIWRFNPITQ